MKSVLHSTLRKRTVLTRDLRFTIAVFEHILGRVRSLNIVAVTSKDLES